MYDIHIAELTLLVIAHPPKPLLHAHCLVHSGRVISCLFIYYRGAVRRRRLQLWRQGNGVLRAADGGSHAGGAQPWGQRGHAGAALKQMVKLCGLHAYQVCRQAAC